MYKDDYEKPAFPDRESEEIYSKPIRAGKRTYFFDVKATKGNNDFFLTITESKRKMAEDGSFTYDKHKIFLYKEDFDKFQEGLGEVIAYMRENLLKDVPETDPEPKPDQTQNPEDGSEPAGESSDSGQFTNVRFEEL